MPRNVDERRQRPVATTDGMLLFLPTSARVTSQDVNPAFVNPFITGGTVQQYPLGTELWYGSRKFKYAKAGSVALATAKLMQSVVPLAGHIDEVCGGGSAGATTINFTPNTVTTDDVTANELADGYIHINSGVGLGYAYRIKSHPAILGAASGILTLYDPLVITTATTAKATVFHNPFRNVILHPSPPTAPVVGVTCCVVTASEYCWLQFQGPAPVLIDGTVVIKNAVVPSGTADGAVMARIDFQLEPDMGVCMAVNATTEYGLICLNLPGF